MTHSISHRQVVLFFGKSWCLVVQYPSFTENQDFIESKWDKDWGDRMNEMVFIGQDLNKEQMNLDLEKCLLEDHEKSLIDRKLAFKDPFPKNI